MNGMSVGSYYLVKTVGEIVVVRVKALTQECVLFEFEDKSSKWFRYLIGYDFIEKLSTEIIRELKINQIQDEV